MSESNVELLHRFYEAFNARDIEALIACCDPSIEFHSTFAAVGGGVYHGHDGMRRYFRDLGEAWGDEIRVVTEAYVDLGEHTLMFQVARGRGRHSGAEVTMPIAGVARWRDDLLVYAKAYLHREDALSDMGVTEDELEPIAP
jgi:ketosteroid isomerase-like protein